MPIPGQWEILILALVVLLLFGGKLLPQIARTAGKTVREVKSVKDEVLTLDAPPRPAPQDDQKPAAKAPTIAP